MLLIHGFKIYKYVNCYITGSPDFNKELKVTLTELFNLINRNITLQFNISLPLITYNGK